MLIQEAVVAWMRVDVTDTATRWEVVSEAGFGLAAALTLVNLLHTGNDLWRQVRSGRNGGTRLVARREVRLEAFRLARLVLWLAVFAAFLVDWSGVVLLVALLVPAYAFAEGLDSALNTLSRREVWRYLATEVAREQSEARATAAAVDAAAKVEAVRLTLEANNAVTGKKLDVIAHQTNSLLTETLARLSEALETIKRLELLIQALTGKPPTGEPPPNRPPVAPGPEEGG